VGVLSAFHDYNEMPEVITKRKGSFWLTVLGVLICDP
jgi:hypothetical protein